ncbi:MAG: hypothetical protein ABSE84_03625, partial [Isosphaeraceae bacterium]
IHVCFLRETVFVRTNNPNMEETDSLENPIPSGKCYLELNQGGDNRYRCVFAEEIKKEDLSLGLIPKRGDGVCMVG